jgi:hypothetical protein
MNWSKANFKINIKENRLKVKSMTGPKRFKTLKIKVRKKHYLEGKDEQTHHHQRYLQTSLLHMIDKFLIRHREKCIILYTAWTKYKNEEYDKSKEKPKEEWRHDMPINGRNTTRLNYQS